jgi:hypothetical protein
MALRAPRYLPVLGVGLSRGMDRVVCRGGASDLSDAKRAAMFVEHRPVSQDDHYLGRAARRSASRSSKQPYPCPIGPRSVSRDLIIRT